MADNYLERQRAEYEQRKAQWLAKKKIKTNRVRLIEKPEDEAL